MKSDIKFPKYLPRFLRPVPRTLAEARRFTAQLFGRDLPRARAMPGWLHPDHADMLCYLAHECDQGPIIEIGSFKGKSTVYIAKGMKPGNELIAIDPHILTVPGSRTERAAAGATNPGGATSWTAYRQNLVAWQIEHRVRSVKDFSCNFRQVWNHPISFLWIDGDHTYDAVCRDIDDWIPLVKPGGYLAFHDTHADQPPRRRGGPRRAIDDREILGPLGFSTVLELRNAWFMRRVH